MSTKELREMDSIQDFSIRKDLVITRQDNDGSEISQLKTEILALKRKQTIFQKKEKRIQELCLEWGKKPVEEQNFEAFHRAVTAASNHYSKKFKATVTILSTIIQGQKLARQSQDFGSTASAGSDVKNSKACNIQ
ncbi:hypothetical protein TrispH2_011741 [Trichoplax sp. H2]|nr:hypothetical protein TrispH2_011741 [Trichoplax sp. H2]|eukprot:RDD36047.1 hypothetical protein TrispH2_011741 [Trichoplax sp. H2]